MPELKEVLEDVQREVKAFGDDVKGIKDSMARDLAAVRKIAEDTKGEIGPEVKTQIEALTTSVTEKNAAITATVEAIKKQIDEVEKKANRRGLGAGADTDALEMKAARDFHMTSLAIRNELKAGTVLADDKIDVAGFKAYSEVYANYLRKGERKISDAELKSMSVGSDPDGGYLVTPTVSARMQSIIYESSPMRELAYIENISSDRLELPIDEDEADAGWVGETEARPDTGTPQVGTQTIAVHEIYAKPKATQKLLEDASVDIEAWLGRKVGEKFGRMEATAFVSGNGIRKPRGFLTYANGTTRGFIEQVVSGAATAITFDGLINLITALKEPYAAGAAFLMRRASVGAVLLLKDGNGQYIWRMSQEAGKPASLLGYPVREAADMPAVSAGLLSVAFGNFKRAYTIVDRLGVSTLVDPYSSKPFVEFYSRKRVGGDVTNFEAIKLMKIAAG